MRPTRLELEGFAAFRDPVVVDFTDVDLFAFTGPTGAGKSSLVDAMVFALYGCVARYDDRRLVAPAITQGSQEARVRLDFTIEGVPYTAARVVRRVRTGASTKEARLERGDGTVLGGNEKEVGAAVEQLLGLSFDHFTKCVVLPQGEFARFLHDKPERRQDLLVSLLDLGIYERMARLARAREAGAKARAEAADSRLQQLAFATPAALADATSRATELDELRLAVEGDFERLTRLEHQAASARLAADGASARAAALAAIEVPDALAELGTHLAAAADATAAAIAAEAAAEAATAEGEQVLSSLPARARLELAAAAHEQRAGHMAQREKGVAVLAERAADETLAEARAEQASHAVHRAEAELERAQWEHRAHDLAAGLRSGEPCPVCEQPVVRVPDPHLPTDLDAAREARRAAQREHERARAEVEAARRERARVDDKLVSIAAQLEAIDHTVADHPDPAAVAAALEEVSRAEADVDSRRAAERQARAARVQAAEALAHAQGEEARWRRAFDDVRDTVAGWGAPPRDGDDLAGQWQRLAEWAAAEAPLTAEAANAAVAAVAALDDEQATLAATIRERAGGLGVPLAGGQPTSAVRDAVHTALVDARTAAARLGDALDEATTLRAEHRATADDATVAGSLARHLGATGFEKWMLDEALGLLVTGATGILLELSSGQYSLALDARTSNFMVIDHRNADEQRSARTLSGGETFLASLALALALADQLSMLAARGGARLESIFLDEGFGTLDPDTLDTVAAAIEELGATGRMVGLISHVADLAARVPVRYEVTKGPVTSAVTKVVA